MTGGGGRHVLVFNGEIYNFLELAEELRGRGYLFRSDGDSEVLLHGWDRWGEGLFDRLNGMWALAIHDTHSGETVLCRDRYGEKPLYYLSEGDRLVFASEVKAIDHFTMGVLEPDAGYLRGLGCGGTGDRSYLMGVQSVPAGGMVTVRRNLECHVKRWYRMRHVPVPEGFREQAHVYRSLLEDSCRLRLRSDVPVATCLSGGIDSGSIASLLNSLPGGEARFPGFSHRSFNAGFPGTPQDETSAARQLAETCGIRLDFERIDAPAGGELEEALRGCDGPMPCLAFYPVWRIYRRIREAGIKVTLDGMGPDETLGGYALGYPALLGAWQLGKPAYLLDLFRIYSRITPGAGRKMARDGLMLARTIAARAKKQVPRLFAASPAPGHDMNPGTADNALEQVLLHQVFENPLPYLLHQYDRASMANGVECRSPFLDHRIVEYSFSLPLESRIGSGYTKRILREAMKGILPDPIRTNRKKLGFNAPFDSWLGGRLRDWVGDVSHSREFIDSTIFDGKAIARELQDSAAGRTPVREWRVWMPLHTAWWSLNRRKFSKP